MECARERPGGPKEFSPGRQPWVQKAFQFAGAPAGRKNGALRRGLTLTLPPLAGLDPRWGLVSQGSRPGLSSIARYAGSGPASGCRRELPQIRLPQAARPPVSCRTRWRGRLARCGTGISSLRSEQALPAPSQRRERDAPPPPGETPALQITTGRAQKGAAKTTLLSSGREVVFPPHASAFFCAGGFT
jgi:hypothetical protein